MYHIVRGDTAIEYTEEHYGFYPALREKFEHGKELSKQNITNMGIGDRWLTNMEMDHLATYLYRVNRFKNATKQWISEFEYFLKVVEGAYERRQNA